MATFNDGSVPFGSQVITVGITAFVAENISYADSSTVIERRNQDGDPSGQVFIDNFGAGTATLQFATTSTRIPAVGATFTLTRNGAITGVAVTLGMAISEVSDSYSQLEAKKCNISFRRRYN
jgi:hypothetical protein